MAFNRQTRVPITKEHSVTISSGQSVSSAFDSHGAIVCGLIFPSAFTGVTLRLQASVDGTNYYDVYRSDGTPVVIETTVSAYIPLLPEEMAALRFIKLVSSSSEAADRTIKVIISTLGSM